MTRLALLLVAAAAAAQQASPPAESAPGSGRTIRGQVIDPDRDAPVRGVLIGVSERGGLGARTHTDAEGRFTLENVQPGERGLMYEKPGYESLSASRLLVPPTGDLEPVRLELRRYAVIAGRVLDPRGVPLPNVRIQAFAPDGDGAYARAHSRMFGEAETDDHGEYRLYGLRGGRFTLAAIPPPEPAPPGAVLLRYAPQLWPGVDRFDDATAVELGWGEVREGVDFSLTQAPDTLLHGVVELPEPPGPRGPRYRLSIERVDSAGGLLVGHTALPPGGRFAAVGLTPGERLVVASGGAMGVAAPAWGERRVHVSTSGVVETTIAMQQPIPIEGRLILVDPPDLPVMGGVQIRLAGPSSALAARSIRPQVLVRFEADRTEYPFTLHAYPGRNAFERLRWPFGGYAARITLGGRELEAGAFEVPADAAPGEMEIELRFDAGPVTGALPVEPPEPGLQPARPMVRLFPLEGLAELSRPLTGVASGNGAFVVANVPPGRYLAFAGTARQIAQLSDPGVRELHQSRGKRIDVKAGETLTLDIEPLPARLLEDERPGRP